MMQGAGPPQPMEQHQHQQHQQPPWPPMQPHFTPLQPPMQPLMQQQPQQQSLDQQAPQQQPQQQPPWPPMQPQFVAQPDPQQVQMQAQYSAPRPQLGVPSQQQSSSDEVKTLWVGDLQFWMDETYIYNCFCHTGEVASVKVIRNKMTTASEGYGFVEFFSHAAAERALQMYHGTLMPQTEQCFRLNWAAFGMGERRTEGTDLSIFVGDLAPDVNDLMLQETFKSRYSSVKSAKVVVDLLTNRSKGYGFVRFGDENERTHAMTEMNGVYCSSRPMRISVATSKKSLGAAQQYNPKASVSYSNMAYGSMPAQGVSSDNDTSNTTVFVGGLDPNVKDQDLRQVFGQYGDLISVKIPAGKGCGFVQFVHRASAEDAIQKLHGTIIGQQPVRLSWGRSPANKQTQPGGWGQVQSDSSNQWNPGYGSYGQGYDGYGYTPVPQDANAYTYSYPGYGNYPQQAS
ncbi:hypothetical protein L7F22_051148 [Adiantum nelumboides]|nr:hypothetical protein [Adiantum nelumboides]